MLLVVKISGVWKMDREKIRYAAERVLPYPTAQLLLHEISLTDYFVDLQQTERSIQRLRDIGAYEVTKSILLSSKKNDGVMMINKETLMNILQQVMDLNYNQSYRVISRLVRAGKLLEILPNNNTNTTTATANKFVYSYYSSPSLDSFLQLA